MKPLLLFISFLCFFATSSEAVAQDKSMTELESGFAAMLKNANLKGSWVPVNQGATGKGQGDSYQVVRATKIKGDRWHIVSRAKHKGQAIEFPIPVIIKWAGDTAVMILDEIPTAGGKKYSARVMFHNDRYAGSWWGKNQPGGLLSGAINRSAE